MRDPLDTLALFDALPEGDQAALNAALAERPELAAAFDHWRSLRAAVRADLGRALPDRALLVLHALADEPDGAALLTDEERARLDAAQPALDDAIARHPGLAAAVRRVRDDRADFDRAWAEAVETGSPATPSPPRAARPRPPVHRPDRAALPAVPAGRPTRWVWRAAALVAVVGFAAVLTMLWTRDAGWDRVASAEPQTVTLPDGSTVDLAAGAVLETPPASGDVRQARLRAGNALFHITHDPAHPFTLTTLNAEVAVLGTTFGVEARDAETRVVLVQGAVALAPRAKPGDAVRLAPGQASTVLALDRPSAPVAVDVASALGWTDAVYARETPLSVVAARVAARFGVTVTVDPALAPEPVSGTFSGDRPADVLGPLAQTLGARLVADSDTTFRIAGGTGR